MRDRYASATALRQALEDRLRVESQTTGVPLDRLHREVAFRRFLARLTTAAPGGAWALKGGDALIARLGHHVRRAPKAPSFFA